MRQVLGPGALGGPGGSGWGGRWEGGSGWGRHVKKKKVKNESEVTQSCPTLSDPMDCSPPGSSVHGIFQARVLQRGTIAFSKAIVYRVTKSQA